MKLFFVGFVCRSAILQECYSILGALDILRLFGSGGSQ